MLKVVSPLIGWKEDWRVVKTWNLNSIVVNVNESSRENWGMPLSLSGSWVESSNMVLFVSLWLQVKRHTLQVLISHYVFTHMRERGANFLVASIAQHTPDFLNVCTIHTGYVSSLSRLFCSIKVYNYQINLNTSAPPSDRMFGPCV